jgi:7-cyano-7-deazaguanine synthase
MNRNHLVVLSGGLDSTGALAYAGQVAGLKRVTTVSFNYGQRHARELEAARRVAQFMGVPHRVIDLSGLLHGSALVDPTVPVPEGHYADQSMKATVVNGRNLLFAAAAVAASSGERAHVWLGVHAGDHPIYPDCRPEFWGKLADLVQAAYGVTIHTPFLYDTKAQALSKGLAAGAPYWMTYSCYNGGTRHCGRCGTCVERAEAFAEAGVTDPTEYEDANYWRTAHV